MCTLLLNNRTLNVEVFRNKNFSEDLLNQLNMQFSHVVSPDMARLITKMLDIDPKKRPSSELLVTILEELTKGHSWNFSEFSIISHHHQKQQQQEYDSIFSSDDVVNKKQLTQSPHQRSRRVALAISKIALTPLQKLLYGAGVSHLLMEPTIYADYDGAESNLAKYGIDMESMSKRCVCSHFNAAHFTQHFEEIEESIDDAFFEKMDRSKWIHSFTFNQWLLILTSPSIHCLPLFPHHDPTKKTKECFIDVTLMTYSWYTTPQSMLKKCFELVHDLPEQFFEESLWKNCSDPYDTQKKEEEEEFNFTSSASSTTNTVLWFENDYQLENETFPYWRYCRSLGEYRLFSLIEFLVKVGFRSNDYCLDDSWSVNSMNDQHVCVIAIILIGKFVIMIFFSQPIMIIAYHPTHSG